MGLRSTFVAILLACVVSSGSLAAHQGLVDHLTFNLTFIPESIDQLVAGQTANVTCTYVLRRRTHPESEPASFRSASDSLRVSLQSTDPDVAGILDNKTVELTVREETAGHNSTDDFHFTVKGYVLGYADVQVIAMETDNATYGQGEENATAKRGSTTALDENGQTILAVFHTSIVRSIHPLHTVFRYLNIVYLCTTLAIMGAHVEFDVVKEVFEKPVAPAIAMFCQFVIMPLTGFCTVKVLSLEGGVGLGLFALACCPGGNGSNLFTYLLNGDITLSVVMTTVSTVGALGALPLWMLALGRSVLQPEGSTVHISIPYGKLALIVGSTVLPVAIGCAFKYFKPRWVTKLLYRKIVKVVLAAALLIVQGLAIFTASDIFMLVDVKTALAALALPYVAMVLAGGISRIFKQSWKRVFTIAIETGVQNHMIAVYLLLFSFPRPASELAMTAAVVAAAFTPLPLILSVFCRAAYRCCVKDNKRHHAATVSSDADVCQDQAYAGKLSREGDEDGSL